MLFCRSIVDVVGGTSTIFSTTAGMIVLKAASAQSIVEIKPVEHYSGRGVPGSAYHTFPENVCSLSTNCVGYQEHLLVFTVKKTRSNIHELTQITVHGQGHERKIGLSTKVIGVAGINN